VSLALDGVRYSWPGGREAVAGIGFELRQGDSIAVLGPNGAGKSTLLGIASGRLRPGAGRAELDGFALCDMDPRSRACRVALLPQLERLPFNYDCLDFVLLGRAPHVPALSMPGPADESRARAALERLGLGGFARRPVDSLSGGELQLARLARCLAQEADFILLDEPASMLDPANSLLVGDALRDLASEGHAILFSAHDAAFAGHAAGSALLIRGGRAVASGSARDVLVPDLLEAAFGVPFAASSMPTVF
jgi:iron complex transport system ATP-binding protein